MSRWPHELSDLLVDSLRAADLMIEQADRLVRGRADEDPRAGADDGRPAWTADAVSEWANRALRRATSPDLGRLGPRGLVQDLIDAATASRPAELDDRPWLLPASLPLAVAGLLGEQLLRSEALLRTQRPEVLPGFLRFVAKTWSDLPIYFTLQYGRLLEELRSRLARRPHDPDLRFALASTLLECGLFRQAAEQFEALPSGERRSRHWAMVARCRAGDFENAVEHGRACLDAGAEATSRLWLHQAVESLRRAGHGGDGSPEADETLTIFSRRPQIDGLFELEEISSEIGLNKISGGRGTAVADFTGDGRLDIAVAGAHSGVSLYLNRGDGTFDDASVGSGLDESLYAFSLAAADYDNDGRVDLFATGLGFFDGQGLLFKNTGGGRFEDVTRDAGLEIWGPGFTATWVDYDGDGWLDLFVVNNLGGLFDRKTPNRLFKNNRDGTFSDVTRDAGLSTPWPSLGHCWGDFTNDGLPDLFISNFGRAQLFKNLGDGTFEDVSRQAGVDRPAIGSVAVAVDVDHDGWLDIVQLTYSRPEDALHTLEHGAAPPGASPPRLWRNRRDGSFEQVGADRGLVGAWGTMSANLGDLGNRGRWDLALGNGDPSMDRFEPTVLYAQHQDGRFREVSAAAGLPLWGKGHGVNLADLAGDGHLCLIVGHGGLYPGDLMRTTVHRPRGEIGRELGHYVNLRLVAKRGHHQALGARLRIDAGGSTQHLHVSPGSAFGWLPLEQHVGLGEAQEIDALHIRWPGGQRQVLRGLPVDRTLEIVEAEGSDAGREDA